MLPSGCDNHLIRNTGSQEEQQIYPRPPNINYVLFLLRAEIWQAIDLLKISIIHAVEVEAQIMLTS